MIGMLYNTLITNSQAVRQTLLARPNLYRRFSVGSITSPRFYVYVLARPDGSPFYVGKGSGHRVHDHEKEARKGHRCRKCNVIRKIWRNGGEVQKYIVFTTDNESEAYTYEAELIAQYGRDVLVNLHAGGLGGVDPSPEARARMSAAQKGKKASPETRAHMSAVQAERQSSPEFRSRMSASVKAAHASPEFRALQSVKIKAIKGTPLERARQGAAMKKVWERQDERARRIASITAAIRTPEHRAKKSAQMKEILKSPEIRAKMSATQKARAADPEERARRSAWLTGRPVSEESREKMRQSAIAREARKRKAKDNVE